METKETRMFSAFSMSGQKGNVFVQNRPICCLKGICPQFSKNLSLNFFGCRPVYPMKLFQRSWAPFLPAAFSLFPAAFFITIFVLL
jgi:hypothetical protein